MVEIEWSKKAENNLDEILEDISQNSPQYTKSFLKGIFEIIENLEHFPRLGRKVPELNNPQYRELIYKKYRIVYKHLEEEKILIITIRHAHRLLNMDKFE